MAKAVRATSITPESPAKARQISSALYNPHPDDPLDEAVARHWKTNEASAMDTAREWTRQFAVDS